ncbi:MAG: NUDIX domain-containing protein [Pseudohongiella sp.]|nr:NUDIX domain-containing protein [Pseudohongiella sp.]
MSEHLPVFGSSDVEVLERVRVFQGFFAIDKITLRHRLYEGGWTQPFMRELFVKGRAAGVLLYDPGKDAVVLVEQFRIGMSVTDSQSAWAIELVAGFVEADETPLDMAAREVKEEAGLDISEAQFICEYYNSPGGSDERISLFYAEVDSSTAGGVHGLADENEDIRVLVLSRAEAINAIQQGSINNAMAIIALQWLQIRKLESAV